MGITIKGKSGGAFEIVMQSGPYDDIKRAVADKFTQNRDFFSGARLSFSGKKLSKAQQQDLKRLLLMDYDITHVSFLDELPQEFQKVKTAPGRKEKGSQKRVDLISKNFFPAKSVFISHTLRSGQRVECEGDVVVLGDVNDGAEVIAGGSVAVMGSLRGLVHAGAMGRSDVVVAANALMPKQLRISGKIAVFPENKTSDIPEIAEYKQGSIVIRPLKPKAGRTVRGG